MSVEIKLGDIGFNHPGPTREWLEDAADREDDCGGIVTAGSMEEHRDCMDCGTCHDCIIRTMEAAHDAELAALRDELARVKGELTAREHEVSRMRDVIRETEHERELLERYGRELDEIGRMMGCDHKDDGYMRCIMDHFVSAESKLAAAVAERDAMREALRPFAEAAVMYRKTPEHRTGQCGVHFSLASIRRAAALLAARASAGKGESR